MKQGDPNCQNSKNLTAKIVIDDHLKMDANVIKCAPLIVRRMIHLQAFCKNIQRIKERSRRELCFMLRITIMNNKNKERWHQTTMIFIEMCNK